MTERLRPVSSPEFRQQEIERLNAEADAIEEFYTNLEREGDARQQ